MIFDTNTLIAYLNGETGIVNTISSWRAEGRPLFIPSIVRAELLSLPNLSLNDILVIKEFLRDFIPIIFDDSLADDTAYLRRLYRLSLPDAAIAASALQRQAPLVTRDKQFKKVKEISVIEI